MRLYRPVGIRELALIFDAEMRAFPPRLPEQPIFYPVLNAPYARQITRNWNATSGNFAGYVTQFEVEDRYVNRYEPHIVGSHKHEELWVPAEELAEFNRHIEGRILVTEAYVGDRFTGLIPDRYGMKGKNAAEQFQVLNAAHAYNFAMDFMMEISASRKFVFLHYPYWTRRSFVAEGIEDERRWKVLHDIALVWQDRFPEIALCYAV